MPSQTFGKLEEFKIIYTLSIVLLLIIALVLDRFKMSMLFLFAAVLLLLARIISVDQFIDGFGNTSILTIFLLITITASTNEYINIFKVIDTLFRNIKSSRIFILRMGSLVALFSSFINNTTVVATMIPYVYSWGKSKNISPSKLLIPLSFAAIVGGMITLIGTSTNLLLNGLLTSNGFNSLGFGDFLIPGILVSISAILFMYFFSNRLLKNGPSIESEYKSKAREYLVETRVLQGSNIVNKSIEEAKLRNLDGVFLTEIIRDSKRIVPVGPSEVILAGDLLLFAGETSKIVDLLKKVDRLEINQEIADIENGMVEAVIAQNSALDRKTLKEVGFREKYNAVVLGVHRKGEKLSGKIGSIVLHSGDLILINGGEEFEEKNARWQDLVIVNTVHSIKNVSSRRRNAFLIALILMIGLVFGNLISIFEGLLGLLFVQVLLGISDIDRIKKNINLDLFIILASSLSIGNAIVSSGAADLLSTSILSGIVDWSPFWVVFSIFSLTFLLTSFITNVAALAIVFPIVSAISLSLNIPPQALFLSLAFGASCSFLTPFSYQTNLMIMEAGNYNLKDFLRIGFPLSLLYAFVFLAFLCFKFNLF